MNISKFFIDRPVLANVLAIVIVLIGGVAAFSLPIAQYPNIVPPTVSVTTNYPGASASTVVNQVALPVELQVNGVEGMIYMQSTSTDTGNYTLTVTFEIGTDLDFAQVLVQNRVSSALASLPQAVQAQGLTVQKKSTSILEIVSLFSTDGRYDSLFLSNYATINLVNELSRVPGVGNVTVLGVGTYSMRIWLDPQKLYTYSLTPNDVIQVVKSQSQSVTAGQTGMPPAGQDQSFQYTSTSRASSTIRRNSPTSSSRPRPATAGRIVRLKDVGRGRARRADLRRRLQGRRQARGRAGDLPDARGQRAGRRPGGREEDEGAQERLPARPRLLDAVRHHRLRQDLDQRGVHDPVRGRHPGAGRDRGLPAGLARHAGAGHHHPGHHHRLVRRDGALGFTINLSTLFGIVLAIGIVVDDAIVIVEGVARHIERGMSSHDAAIKAMNELLGR
jgi:HAE1 family hydrophobic/amphiphilic exporter-1